MRRRLLLELGYQLLNQDVIPPESRQVL
jgi:hypothetical protein